MKNKKNLIFLNKNLNCLIFKHQKKNVQNYSIYIYNVKYFFHVYSINLTAIFYNKNLNSLIFYKKFSNSFNILNYFFSELIFFYYKKIIFSGKGFKLKKNKKFNIFNFNNSHIKYFIEKKNKLIKNSKNSFIYIYKNINSKKKLNFFLKLFKLNIFTKRGVKFNRSYLLVKKLKKNKNTIT